MVKFLFVGDLHLRGTNPRNRIDDYKEVAKQKLKEVFKIAVDNAVDAILQPGDIFDRPEVGIAVLLEFAEVLKESPVNIYCTLGNHDIYGYNVDSYYRTSLRLLEMLVPQLTVIRSASDKPIYLAKGHYKVYLTATPYSKDMDINGYGYGPDVDYPEAEVCAMSLSAACDEARAIFIDNPGANQFEPGLSRSEARKRLFDILEQYFFTNHKIVKIAVNMNFETKFTAKYGKYILMPCADPFIAWIRLSQLLLPNKIKNPKRPYVGKGLKPMTKEVFGVQMSEFTSVLERNQALFFDQVPNDEHDALSYCCEDSDYAVQHYLYWDEVAKQISNDNEVYPTYSDWLKNIEMPFTRVTGIMEYWGMKWDSDIAQVKREEAKNAIEIAAQTMKDLAASVGIKDLNVGVGGKTKDVKSFVFDTLKLPAAAWSDKTKDPSLDSNALMDMIFMLENKLEDPDEEKYLETPLPEEWEMVDPDLSYQDQRLLWPREYTTAEVKRIRIARREEHPYKDIGIKFLKSMQTIQKYATLLSSHVEGREKYVNPVTGRIHAKYEPWTETARLASNSPNGQNVPRPDNDELGVRNFYKAEPGKVFLLEDESGFELRLTAWKSGCEVMRKAFRDHEDLHRKTAATMTGKPEAEVTKHERSGAKAGNFGSVYGGTEHALQKTFKKMGLRKSLPECKTIVDAVMKTYPGIPLESGGDH